MDRSLFPPLSSSIHSTNHRDATHPHTQLLPPPSLPGAFWIEPLWFALSYCMRHKCMENDSRVIVLLGFVFRTKRCFLTGVGRTPAWEKQVWSSQNALWGCYVNELPLNCKWHPQDCQMLMEMLGKMRMRGPWCAWFSGSLHAAEHGEQPSEPPRDLA